ncbi:hypothetical protein LCGC14_0353530 [marine sediment metagenome]|uniref:Uncharacterized protein n=1 Tax=marine sediment metagenome TaxID=412755 RepID=A0A0F9VXD8_9ZZZZ
MNIDWDLIARQAEMDQRHEQPRGFVITQRFLPPVKLTPEEVEEAKQAWNEKLAAWHDEMGYAEKAKEYAERAKGYTEEAKPSKTTIIGFCLSKLGIKK